MYRISGFSDNGEARIVDDHGQLVAYGALVLETAFTRPEKYEQHELAIKVTWAKEDELEALFSPTQDWRS